MNPLPALLIAALLMGSSARADDIQKVDLAKYKLDKTKFDQSAGSVFGSDQKSAGAALDDQARVIGGSSLSPAAQASQMKDVDGRRANIGSCDATTPFNAAGNPDTGSSWTCTGDMYEVMTYGAGNTSRKSNAGMIAYLRKSLLSDCAFYSAAFNFYSDLKRKGDLAGGRTPGAGDGASIDLKGINLWPMAKKAVVNAIGVEDPYLAMKVLILYGHDNRFNFVSTGGGSNACQVVLPDTIKPNANSFLYLNGSIGHEYFSDDVDRAKSIFASCKSAAAAADGDPENCGEYTQYQADYYHVITSAFLHCRCLAGGQSIIDKMSDGLQRNAYLWMVSKYKHERFAEEVKKGVASKKPAMLVLQKAWDDKFGTSTTQEWKVACDSTKASSCLDRAAVDSWPWQAWCDSVSGCKPTDIAYAKALAKLYVFEINFRINQHFQGIMLAKFSFGCDKASVKHQMCN